MMLCVDLVALPTAVDSFAALRETGSGGQAESVELPELTNAEAFSRWNGAVAASSGEGIWHRNRQCGQLVLEHVECSLDPGP